MSKMMWHENSAVNSVRSLSPSGERGRSALILKV